MGKQDCNKENVQGETECGGDKIQDGREENNQVQGGKKCGNERICDRAAMEKSSRYDKIQGLQGGRDNLEGETKCENHRI